MASSRVVKMSSESEQEEWEDVQPLEGSVQPEHAAEEKKPAPLAGSLEVVLQGGGSLGDQKRRRKRQQDYLVKYLRARAREVRFNTHKVHLLCLVSHGMLLSNQCDDRTVQALAMSLTRKEFLSLGHKETDLTQKTLLKFLTWFASSVKQVYDVVKLFFANGSPFVAEQVQLLVCLLRALGLRTRLVIVLDPLPFKEESKSSIARQKSLAKRTAKVHEQLSSEPNLSLANPETVASDLCLAPAVSDSGQDTPNERSSPYLRKRKRKGEAIVCSDSEQSSSDDEHFVTPPPPPKVKRARSIGKDGSVEKVPAKRRGKTRASSNIPPTKKLRKTAKKSPPMELPSTCKDESACGQKRSTSSRKVPPASGEVSKAALSEYTTEEAFYDARSCWVEVCMCGGGEGGRWVCLHLPSGSVGQPQQCEQHCPRPLHYVIAIENSCCVQDVTARYASGWCIHTRKQRLDDVWWAESLQPYQPSRLDREEEDKDFLSILSSQPMPTSISDYKGHPLYVLQRHLLKFEVIYPVDCQPVGSCKGAPVFSRDSVHTLHTRETWLKEARLVRRGEKPFKKVKARPKRGQSVLSPEAGGAMVEVFGLWQTEDYQPPPVVNGKVPRNEYGNLELFKPSMLPAGGCHIAIAGIQKVCRKLAIDFAPAVVGWDFHSGRCHPVLEGVVVPAESRGVLLEAWQQHQQLSIERDIQKREKRILELWRRLVRGLVIRERVYSRYSSSSSQL